MAKLTRIDDPDSCVSLSVWRAGEFVGGRAWTMKRYLRSILWPHILKARGCYVRWMQPASNQPYNLQGFRDFLNATRALASPSRVAYDQVRPEGSAVASVAANELGEVARRLAEIVLSATSEDDLAQALDDAFAHDDFQHYCELRMGLMFSLRGPVTDPLLPLEVRRAFLASCYTIIAITARDVAIADGRSVPPWLIASLDRYARAGIEATQNLPGPGTKEMNVMISRRDAREQRVETMCRMAADSGQAVFWPFRERDD